MSSKDHETERALLKSHIDNLEKQLKDRDVLLRDLEGSKESGTYIYIFSVNICVFTYIYVLMCVCMPNWKKQLKDRDVLLRDLEGSKKSGIYICISVCVYMYAKPQEAAQGSRRASTRFGRVQGIRYIYIICACTCVYIYVNMYIYMHNWKKQLKDGVMLRGGGWGRNPKKCTGRVWGMGSSTI